jgi:hypothetical protein
MLPSQFVLTLGVKYGRILIKSKKIGWPFGKQDGDRVEPLITSGRFPPMMLAGEYDGGAGNSPGDPTMVMIGMRKKMGGGREGGYLVSNIQSLRIF